jgi:hypothetical protein
MRFPGFYVRGFIQNGLIAIHVQHCGKVCERIRGGRPRTRSQNVKNAQNETVNWSRGDWSGLLLVIDKVLAELGHLFFGNQSIVVEVDF